MPQLSLLPHVHAAAIGADLVLLDVRADAYLCLRASAPVLRPSPGLRHFDPETPGPGEVLLARGLAATGPSGAPREGAPPALPGRSVRALPNCRLGPLDALRLILACFDLVLHYAWRPLGQVLRAAERGRRRPPSTPSLVETLRLARLFQIWVIWLPVPRKCLVRSFLLLRFLQRSGCSADWVFGVRTWPFGAHCWLQLGDVALDDEPERLTAYQPILAVRG